MLGALAGDICGSVYEWDNIKTKDFELFKDRCFLTDDSYMTAALAKAILECRGDYDRLPALAVKWMQQTGRMYPDAGYGFSFFEWLWLKNPVPYNSFGNGSAMRVSACAYAADSLVEALSLSRKVTEVTHNHPEGIKGAEAVTAAIWMALHGSSIQEIREYVDKNYYPMNFTLNEIRPSYSYDITCQGTVPQAITAFLESTGFEDALRNAVSIGGDSDTVAAITGSIAEAYYGIPEDIRKTVLSYADDFISGIIREFEARFGSVPEKKHPMKE